MSSAKVWVLAGVTMGAALATACFGPKSDGSESAPQEVNERAVTLSAVVTLEGGCTATKIGPKQLLVAARCVANKPAYAIGKPLKFKKGNVTIEIERQRQTPSDASSDATDAGPQALDGDDDAGADAGPNADDAGAPRDAGSPSDAGTDSGTDGGLAGDVYEETIAKIEIHPSFLQKCGNGTCALAKAGAADVADVAVIITSREIVDLGIAPIDLDTVVPKDEVLVLSSGCDPNAPRLRAKAAKAAPTDSVVHDGSPFQPAPELRAALARSYVVTLGPGNTNARESLGICSDRDLGAPLFRGDGSAIVGINANYTVGLTGGRTPVTSHHARVDLLSQHNVGKWLSDLGAKTLKSCSDSDGGCPVPPDAETPKSDASAEAGSQEEPPPSTGGDPLPEGEEPPASDDGTQPRDRTPPKASSNKNKASDSGCSAAPQAPSGSSFGLVAVALGLVASRLRRRR